MLRRRAFAEIHFRYALDLRRAAPVCKDRLLRAYRLSDAACDLVKRGQGGPLWTAYRLPSCVISFGDGWSCVRKEK